MGDGDDDIPLVVKIMVVQVVGYRGK